MYLTFGLAAVTSLPKRPDQFFPHVGSAIAFVRYACIYASVSFSKLYGSGMRLRGELSDFGILQITVSIPPPGAGSATQLFLKLLSASIFYSKFRTEISPALVQMSSTESFGVV